LAFLWCWKFTSLCKVEWEGKQLLAIRCQIFSTLWSGVDRFLVCRKLLVYQLNQLLWTCWNKLSWLFTIVYLIGKSLKSKWITSCVSKLFLCSESEVFTSMYLTKKPEDIILISASSLNLELGSKVGSFLVQSLTVGDSIEESGLSQWFRMVEVQVISNLICLCKCGSAFEKSKSTNQVNVMLVGAGLDSTVSRLAVSLRELWENLGLRLIGTIKSNAESSY